MGIKPPLPPWLEHAAAIRKALKTRGFKPVDRVQICQKCDEYAEESWSLQGGQGMGGRELMWCANCGRSRSWKGSIGGQRIVEEPFDLASFLNIKIDPPPGAPTA